MTVAAAISEVVAATPDVTWSVAVTGAPGVEAAHDPGRKLSTASIGKILLLAETARQIADGVLDPAEQLPRDPALAVADSGLWQHLTIGALPVADVAVLVAAVSDNYATNVLLQRIGTDAVAALTASLKLESTSLNRMVRAVRTDNTRLSTGSARELAALMLRLSRGKLISPAVSARLDHWLGLNTDLSMVAAGLHLDPLAHAGPDRGRLLRNKTGTDDGVRADVGHLGRSLAYAVLANWDPSDGDRTDEVMEGMRRIGVEIAAAAPTNL